MGPPAGHRWTTRDITGTSWDACVLVLSCVRLVLVNYKMVSICKFIVIALCTKTRLFNLRRNYGHLPDSLFSFVVTIVIVIALDSRVTCVTVIALQ